MAAWRALRGLASRHIASCPCSRANASQLRSSAAAGQQSPAQPSATPAFERQQPAAGEASSDAGSPRGGAVCGCASVQPAKPTVPPVPGSVTPYAHHVLIRLPPPAGQAGRTGDAWWPPILERHPALLQAFAAVAAAKRRTEGVVKVTAYDCVIPPPGPHDAATVDVMVFPAGACLSGLPTGHIKTVVAHHITEQHGGGEAQPLALPPQVQQRSFDGVGLFVCAHGSRDSRCGLLGRALAARLRQLVEARGLERVQVFQVSHVGGHKYAGNVLVYGGISPCDGDWFGGVTADCAERFLDALLAVQVGEDGGAGSPLLRRWWRGRMGLSAAEQLELFEAGPGIPAGEGWAGGSDSDSEGSTSDSASDSGSDSSSDSD